MRKILLLTFFMAAVFSLFASSKDDTMTTDNIFNADDKVKMDIDLNTTLEKKDNNEQAKPAVNIRETLKKDPEAAKKLEPQLKELNTILSEAKRYRNAAIAKSIEQLINSVKTMQLYHNDKEVKDAALTAAYNNLLTLNSAIARIKMQLKIAKQNNPRIRKIRELRRLAQNYYSRSATAATLGQKTKAEYYKNCARIIENAALNYAKNPKIEATAKAQLQKAEAKYNHDDAKESAVRFRKRAERERKQGNDAKAEYYDKVADLKERLAKAYATNNSSLVKSILQEYRKLQAGAPM